MNDRFEQQLAIPPLCRVAGCAVEVTPDRASGWWVRHGDASRRFLDPSAVSAWLSEFHGGELEPFDMNTIALPAECRTEGCAVEVTRAEDRPGYYAQHGSVSQHFEDPGLIGPWCLEQHPECVLVGCEIRTAHEHGEYATPDAPQEGPTVTEDVSG